MFGHIARMPDETDAKKIITGAPWRTGGDHQDVLVLHGWRLSSKTWNPITSPWMKQLTWLRIVHSGDWCVHSVLCSPSGVCHTRSSKLLRPRPLWQNQLRCANTQEEKLVDQWESVDEMLSYVVFDCVGNGVSQYEARGSTHNVDLLSCCWGELMSWSRCIGFTYISLSWC